MTETRLRPRVVLRLGIGLTAAGLLFRRLLGSGAPVLERSLDDQ